MLNSNKTKQYWRCSKSSCKARCKARITTNKVDESSNHPLKVWNHKNFHNHPASKLEKITRIITSNEAYRSTCFKPEAKNPTTSNETRPEISKTVEVACQADCFKPETMNASSHNTAISNKFGSRFAHRKRIRRRREYQWKCIKERQFQKRREPFVRPIQLIFNL
jgi:hypothetical protein